MKILKKWFTLVEMLIVVSVLWLVFVIIINAYYKLIDSKTDIYVRSLLTQNTNTVAEKINLIMKNYTIDYEEYFNRRMVGCDQDGWENFTWDVGENWYCDKFTTYWNSNWLGISSTWNVLYYCSSVASDWTRKEVVGWTTDCEWEDNTWSNYIYAEKNSWDLENGSGCWLSLGAGKVQSYGEYAVQFWDVNKNADWVYGCKWDDDDVDLWKWPIAIGDNSNIKELYLISKDWKKRILLRRKLIYSGDLNNDGRVDNWEKLYKIQILKLRWFDLWENHDWNWKYAYDGKIDTWACDKAEGFICKWLSLDSLWYIWYNLPEDINDWWKDYNITDLSIDNLNFTIYPSKLPTLAWQEDDFQIYPFVQMDLTTRFYWKNYLRKINPEALSGYRMRINTMFSIKEY